MWNVALRVHQVLPVLSTAIVHHWKLLSHKNQTPQTQQSIFSTIMVLKILAFCIAAVTSAADFWPMPRNVTSGSKVQIDPCSVSIRVSTIPAYLKQLVDFYRTKVFLCNGQPSGQYSLDIVVGNSSLLPPLRGLQGYSLNLTGQSWSLKAGYFPGLARGLQTFSQAFYQGGVDLPLIISDEPQFQYRGVMLDTSRHYYPVEYIYHLIDSLMFNKLNVLHWHIVDEDSFPLEIPVNPNLSKMGSFNNKTYSPEQISSIVDYGLKRAVRIIPEIDTPAHTESWGRSLQPSDFVMLCSNPYAGQFDPTMDKTYEWVDQVLNYTVQKFPDSFVHFGGDEVRQGCWGSRSSIKDFMAKNNLTNYNQLEVYYRKREKANYRKYSNKTVMYWANQRSNLPVDDEDVLHWWGASTHFVSGIGNRTNKVVISFNDKLYIDIGFGNAFSNTYGTQLQWYSIFECQYKYKIPATVIGAATTLWGQTSNMYTADNRLWPRTSAMAERLWNGATYEKNYVRQEVLKRLNQHSYRLRARGVRFTPISDQVCQTRGEC